jgi:secondary thiamine-phosphate synthase enzyme
MLATRLRSFFTQETTANRLMDIGVFAMASEAHWQRATQTFRPVALVRPLQSKSLQHQSRMWIQRNLTLPPHARGFHLVTETVLRQMPEIRTLRVGLFHLFIQHTSASLTINENADPDVRIDFETAMNHAVPESLGYVHTIEGPDDMPAHVKASMLGASLSIPIANGRLALGTWQGIYLCEHRDAASSRSVVATLQGEAIS